MAPFEQANFGMQANPSCSGSDLACAVAVRFLSLGALFYSKQPKQTLYRLVFRTDRARKLET